MIEVYQQNTLDYFDLTAGALDQSFAQTSKMVSVFSIPEKSFNPLRQQYDAMTIINYISSLDQASRNIKLGIVDKDIYTHGMNFIFGLADPLSNTALVSTFRLAGEKKQDRIHKEIVHEIGHMLGLKHCSDTTCVMYFSNTIEDTDRKMNKLCNECRSKIEK